MATRSDQAGYARHLSRNRNRNRLMASGSAAAAATMLMLAPQQAEAQQAFEAAVTSTTGTVSVSRSATLDTVTVSSPEAIINWRPNDTTASTAPIEILPATDTLRFTGDADFTVLNRVIPADQSRAIQFNGTVNSDILGTQGGNVWFYSPGGIIVGSTAVFNVGSLLLTSTDIDTSGGLIPASNILLTGASGGGSVTIQNGATINASNYVVAWAPRVEQAGTVNADGNIYYVGAEQGTLGLKASLFDVLIDVGTDDPNGIVHTGTTTGPTGATGRFRAISMISVPKNSFINMLVGGKVGYQEATVAGVSNGIVYLEAGDPFGGGNSSSSIDIRTTQFTSETGAYSSGTVTVTADGLGNDVTVGSAARPVDFTAEALDGIVVTATNGGSFDASADVTLSATDGANGGDITISVTDLAANAATRTDGLLVGGDLTLSAIGTGTGSGAVGGNVTVNVGANADFTVGGALNADVSAVGSQAGGTTDGADGVAGGNAQAGTIAITNQGVFSVPILSLKASALGGVGFDGDTDFAGGNGGSARGGTIDLVTLTRLEDLTDLSATADATGGAGGQGGNFLGGGVDTSGGTGGFAVGGTITLNARGASAAIQPTSRVQISSEGTGGNGGTGGVNTLDFGATGAGGAGGIGLGGELDVFAEASGTVALPTDGAISVAGTGGQGGVGGDANLVAAGSGGLGGAAAGGTFILSAITGGTISASSSTGTLTLDASGTGGSGGDGGAGITGDPGQAGSVFGGTIRMAANASTIDVTGNLVANASAVGVQDLRANASGNDATGGTILANALNGGTFSVSGGLWADASALAAIGPAGAGTAIGGDIDFLMSGVGSVWEVLGTFDLSFPVGPRQRSVYANASAYEPQSGNPLLTTAVGGDTNGGSITLDFADGTSTIAGRTDFDVGSGANNPLSGSGPSPQLFINGATAIGGNIDVALTNSTNTWGTFDASLTTFGFGGSAVNGTIRMLLDGATLNLVAGAPASNGSLSLDTYTSGEISLSDPDAIIVNVVNGSVLDAANSIFLFTDAGHGISANTITPGNIVLNVDASDIAVGVGDIDLGSEAQAFRFPGTATNTTGADARSGDLTFTATNGSTVTGRVDLRSFSSADSGDVSGNSLSGTLTYLLDNSIHTGSAFGALRMLSFAEAIGSTASGEASGTAVGGGMNATISGGSTFSGDVDFENSVFTFYNSGLEQGSLGAVSGGDVAFNIEGSDVTIGALTADSSIGSDTGTFRTNGADVSGGAFGLTITGSDVTIGTLAVDTSATAGDGGSDGAGGAGTAGDIAISVEGAGTLSLSDVQLTAQGTGGSGGQARFSGNGGQGSGGDITIFADVGTSLALGTINGSSTGSGGDGGIGSFGLGDGGPGFAGGVGGAASSGNVTVRALGDLSWTQLTLDSSATGGAGGAGNTGADGGVGGTAQGGTAAVEIGGGPAASITIGAYTLDASATGGQGGVGGVGGLNFLGTPYDAGAGGVGGTATGGTARLAISGAGSVFDFDPALATLNADATGGAGGTGGNHLQGGTAGDGGAGGDATGGTIALVAGSDTTLDLDTGATFSLAVTGTGGDGGTGGSIDMASGGLAGNGGDGGSGTGGSPTLRAVGGNIIAPDLNLSATGIGGNGGTGGDDGLTVLGATGNGGVGNGGTPILEALEGSPGRLTLGTVVIDASGIGGGGTVTGTTAGGQITLTDASTDPAGLISMTSLTVTATGTAATPGTPSLTIESDSGAITVANGVNATVSGDIVFNFDNDGQLVVGDSAVFDAGGNITLTHTNNTTPVNSIDVGIDMIATAGEDFFGGDGSIIASARETSITANNIRFDAINAGNDNIFDAGEFALTLNATNGSIIGGSLGSLSATNGVDLDATQAISTGDIAITDGPITIDAGTTLTTGNISINQGGFVSNESITLNAGGDTSLGDVAAIDGLTVTSGGALTAASLRGTGITATATGAVDIGDATIFDGVAGGGGITISGTSVILDSADASTTVGNNIAIDATAGGVTLGTVNSEAFLDVNATGDIIFDTLTATGVFLTTTGGNVTGNSASSDRAINSARPRDVIITAPGDVVVTSFSTVNDVEITAASFDTDSIITGNGVGGLASDVIVNVTGNATIDFADVQGIVDVDASTITIGDILVQAATTLDTTVGDLVIGTITTDGSVVANSAANLLLGSSEKRGTDTLGNESMTFNATGDLTVTGVIDSHDTINLSAGGAVDTQQLIAFDSVTITAGTFADIAGVTTTVFGTGNTVSITAPVITLGASSLIGGLTANATAGNLLINGDVTGASLFDLDATANVDFASLTTGGQVQVNAGGNITGVSSLKTGTDSLANESMSFVAGGSIALTGTVDTHDSIVLTAATSVSANQLTAFDDVTVTAGTTATISDITTTATGNANVTAQSISLGSATLDGNLTIDATAGAIDLIGTIITEGDQTYTAAGNITAVDLTAGANDNFSDDIRVSTDGDFTVTGTISVLDILDVSALGAVDIANAVTTTGGAASISGASVNLDQGSFSGTLALTATAGDVTLNSDIDTEAATTVTASQDILFGTITTSDGNLTLDAGRDVIGTSAINDAPIGSLGLDRTVINAGRNITLTGVAQSVDDGVFLTSTAGTINVASFDAADTISVLADGGAVIVDNAVNANNFDATLRGTSVTLNNGDFANNLFLNATNGSIDGTGTILVGALADFDATQNITFGSITAGTGFNINAVAGDVTFTEANSTDGSVNIIAGGSVVGGSASNLDPAASAGVDAVNITAGGDITLTGTSRARTNIILSAGGNIDAAILDGALAAGVVNVIATGTTSVDTLNSGGDATVRGSSVTLDSGDIGGNLTLDATSGDVNGTGTILVGNLIDIDATGNVAFGALTAGNFFTVDAGGNITFVEANTDENNITMNAGGDITGGSLTTTTVNVGGADNISLSAGGAIDITSAFAEDNLVLDAASVSAGMLDGRAVTVTATGAALVGTANSIGATSITGGSVGLDDGDIGTDLTLNATAGDLSGVGAITVGSAIDLDATGNVGFGSLTAGTFFNADAGGDISFTAAGSGNTMTFNAGGNILGGDVTTDQATADSTFTAGGALTLGDVTTRILTATAGTDLALGAVDALGQDVRGIAIDLQAGGDISFTSLTSGRGIDIDSATVSGGGNITSNNGVDILAQSIAVGDVSITDLGPVVLEATAGDVIAGSLTSHTFGTSVTATGAVTTGDLATIGTANSSDITVTSGGNATIGDAAAGNQLTVNVGGNLIAGNLSSNVVSPATIVNVAGDADIASFDAAAGTASIDIGGALTGGDFSAESTLTFTATSIDIASATSRAGSVFADTFNGAALFTTIDAAVDIGIDASGAAEVGTATSGGDTDILGDSVLVDDGTVGGSLSLQATAGDIDGTGTITVGAGITLDATGNVTFGSLTAQGDIFRADAGGNISFTLADSATDDLLLMAGGQINGGDLNAGLTASLNGARIVIENGSANSIDFTSASDILFNSLTSPNAISLTATNGLIGANTGAGDITSDGDVTLLSQAIAIGDVTTLGSLDADATVGDASFGTVDATNTIDINAAGTPSVVAAISGGDTNITGQSVTLDNGTIGGTLRLNATAGDVDGNGAVTVGGAIDLDATGSIGFGSLDAGTTFNADAGGDLTFTQASAGDTLAFNANGLISGGDLTVANALSLDGASIAIGTATANTMSFTSASDILFDLLSSPNAISLVASAGTIGGNTGAGDIDSGGDVTLIGSTLSLGDITSGGSVTAAATNGGFTGGVIVATGDFDGDASNAVSIDDVTTGGSTSLTGTSVRLAAGTIGGNLALNATQSDLDASGAITVGGAIDLDAGGAITFGTLEAQGGDFTADAAGDIVFTSGAADGDLAFTAAGAITGDILNVPNGTITLAAGGPMFIDHAEAGVDFIATGPGNLTTGLNSIVTGGDIIIEIDGIANLGNSSAGGLIDVAATQIDFVTLAAGSTIDLLSRAPVFSTVAIGDGSINGVDMTAGVGASSVIAGFGVGTVNITGTSTVAGSLDVAALSDATIGTVSVQGGDLTVVSGGTIGFTSASATGSIFMQAVESVIGGSLSANQQVRLLATQIGIDVTDVTAGTDIDLDAAADVVTDNLVAATGIDALAGGDIDILTAMSDAGDIVLSAGGSIFASGAGPVVIDAVSGSALIFAAVDGQFDGDISAASFADISFGGNLVAQNVSAGDGIIVEVTGNADLLIAQTSDGPVSFDVGGNLAAVEISNLGTGIGVPDDNVAISVGGDATLTGSSQAFGDYGLSAGGVISGGDFTAGGTLTIDGADVAIGTGIANIISITSANDILFDLLQSPNAISLTAATGQIAANTGSGDIDSDGDVTLLAEGIALGNASGSSLDAQATAGAASFASVDATGAISVTATGAASIGNATSGGNASLTGATVSLANGAIGGDLTLNATAGDLDASGTITVGGAIDLDATGSIGFGSLDAQGGAFTADAGGDIAFATATGSDAVSLIAAGSITGGDVTATTALTLDGNLVSIGTGNGGTIDIASNTDILFDLLTSPSAISLAAINGVIAGNTAAGAIDSGGDVSLFAQAIGLGDIVGASLTADAANGDATFAAVDVTGDIAATAAGLASMDSAMSGGNTALTGATVTLGAGNVSADLALNATAGNLDANGAITVGGVIDLDATGNVDFGSLDAQGGAFIVDAGGDVTFAQASSAGSIAMNAGGSIAGGDLLAVSDLSLAANLVTIGTGEAASIDIASSTDILFDLLRSPNAISLAATNGVIAGNTAAGAIDSGGDVSLLALDIALDEILAGGDIDATSTNGDLSFQNLISDGTITLVSTSDILADHAEAAVDFIATADRDFTTGLNSIITGGDIVINSQGIVDLGNSNAGGLIDVTGQQIDFVTLLAGDTIDLLIFFDPQFPVRGNGNISGVDMTAGAGQSSAIAVGSVSVTGTSAIAGDLLLQAGTDIGFGTADIQGNLDAAAGGAIGYGSAVAGGSIIFDAGGAIVGGDLTAAGTLALTGADVAIGNGSGNLITIDSGLDILFDSLTSPNAISLMATNGRIAANTGPGDIDSGGDVSLLAQQIALADVTGNSLDAQSTAGDATFGTVDVTGAIAVSATGLASVDAANSGGDTALTGGSVVLSGGAIGGNLALAATAGNLDANGAITVGGAIDLDATGNINFGALDAQGGDFTVDAGGDIGFTDATGSASIVMNGGGAIAGGDLTAVGTLSLDGNSITIGDASAGTIDFTSNTDILFNQLTSPNAISLTASNGQIGANTGPGDIDSGADVTLLAQQIALGDVTSGGSVDAQATLGGAGFGVIDAANDITVVAAGTPTIANVISGGNTSVTGSSVTLTNGTVGGDLALTATAGDLDGTGAVSVGGSISLDASGNVGFGTLDAQGGDFTAVAGGDIAFENAGAAGAINFEAGGSIAGTGDIAAGDAVDLASTGGGDISVASIASGADISAQTGGAFAATSVDADQAGSGQVSIAADDGITTDTLTGNDATLDAANGAVSVAGDIDLTGGIGAFGQSVLLRSSNDLTASADASAGDVDIAIAGSLDAISVTATGDVLLSGANVTIIDGALADGLLDIDAAGLTDIQGSAIGTMIDVTTGDIAIGSTGALGDGTQTEAIAITATNDATVGGDGSASTGFILDNDEMTRVFGAGSLSIFAAGQPDPSNSTSIIGGNLTVEDLGVTAGSGGQTATDGTFELGADGDILVTGEATVSGATTDTLFSLGAGNLLRVDTSGGNLRVEDANGGIAGTLLLSGTDVAVVSDAALADIAGASLEDINDRLGENDGIIRDEGFLQSSVLNISASSGIFIQNSGDGDRFDDRRGFTVDSLTITDASDPGVAIVINGVVGGAMGIDAIDVTQIEIDFDSLSTINGCLIVDPTACLLSGEGFDDRLRDLRDRELRSGDRRGSNIEGIDTVLIELRDTTDYSDDPLIDDPVTGAGNEDLWTGDIECDVGDEDGGFCPSGEGAGEEEDEELEPAE